MPGKVPKPSPAAAGPAAPTAAGPAAGPPRSGSPQGPVPGQPAGQENTPADGLSRLTPRQQHRFLKDVAVPLALQQIHGVAGVGPPGTKLLVAGYLAEARKSTDPVERMVLEQMVLVHHRLCRLHVEAAGAQSLEQARVLNGAAARLTAELRRLVLAIRAYRMPPSARSFSVIKMENARTGARGEQATWAEEPVEEKKNALSSHRGRLAALDGDNGDDTELEPPAAAVAGSRSGRPAAAAAVLE